MGRRPAGAGAGRATQEAADLAYALNGLAEALATSEGRQREFLLSVSHELRTPLTTIRGYAEALADGVVTAEGAPRAGRTVLAEAERLDRLVTDLLALARLDAVDFTLAPIPIDLARLVAEAAEAWRPRCDAAGIVLRVEVAPAPTGAYADPGRIRQVIDGLMENALRVVPSGAPVVLAVGAHRPPARSRCAVLEVRDGGPGFTDDDLAVAFERGALQPALPGRPQDRQRARPGAGGRSRPPDGWPDRGGPRARGRRPVHRLAARSPGLTQLEQSPDGPLARAGDGGPRQPVREGDR